ncbi:ECF transporter S component [Levilactobacillus yonginensis]|uniref:ECF transporter S component n=1 Tax=Levilactobacillus yonginensis TaxID=1054041 RepID=UPI000F773F6A|nr:ECF transporter S component [Levilactobacillus yonginensis]
MKRGSLRENTLAAVLIAMTVALSILVVIPIPATKGMVTLCEVGIYTSAILYGGRMGFLVGGASGFLIDILTGYPVWCLFSLVIHGTQGLAVGYFTPQNNKSIKTMIVPLLIGSVIMVVGYFFATALLFGWPAGLASIFSNIIQVGFGMVVTLSIVGSLAKLKPNLV